jgi:ectoine hydroxylase-related dioxygenase (phytanoyl-CoA dioxygenase family)
MITNLERDGFVILPRILNETLRLEILSEIEASLPKSAAGVRNLTRKLSSVARLAHSPIIRNVVEPVLGHNAQLVRSILFNKSDNTNWQVAWHQDLAIAVQKREELDGFTSWSEKEGIPHVQPPVEILKRMLNVRVHLDAADDSNGALWVSPGSHRLGRLPANEAAGTATRLGKRLCAVAAGDTLLFRPLTLHASRKVVSNRPRRVIHLEFAGVSLPTPLAWAALS